MGDVTLDLYEPDYPDRLALRAQRIVKAVVGDGFSQYTPNDGRCRVEALITHVESRLTILVYTQLCVEPEKGYHLAIEFFEPLLDTDDSGYVFLWGGGFMDKEAPETGHNDPTTLLDPLDVGGAKHFKTRGAVWDVLDIWLNHAISDMETKFGETLWQVRCLGTLLRLEYLQEEHMLLHTILQARPLTEGMTKPPGHTEYLN